MMNMRRERFLHHVVLLISVLATFLAIKLLCLTHATSKEHTPHNSETAEYLQLRRVRQTEEELAATKGCIHKDEKHESAEEWDHITTKEGKKPIYGFRMTCINGKVDVLGCYENEMLIPVDSSLQSNVYKGFAIHCNHKGFNYKANAKQCRGHPVGEKFKQGFYEYHCTKEGLKVIACLDGEGVEKKPGEQFKVAKSYLMICKETDKGLIVEATGCIDQEGNTIEMDGKTRSEWYVRTCLEHRNKNGRQTEVALNLTHCCEATTEHCIPVNSEEPSELFPSQNLTFACVKTGDEFSYRFYGPNGQEVKIDEMIFGTTIQSTPTTTNQTTTLTLTPQISDNTTTTITTTATTTTTTRTTTESPTSTTSEFKTDPAPLETTTTSEPTPDLTTIRLIPDDNLNRDEPPGTSKKPVTAATEFVTVVKTETQSVPPTNPTPVTQFVTVTKTVTQKPPQVTTGAPGVVTRYVTVTSTMIVQPPATTTTPLGLTDVHTSKALTTTEPQQPPTTEHVGTTLEPFPTPPQLPQNTQTRFVTVTTTLIGSIPPTTIGSHTSFVTVVTTLFPPKQVENQPPPHTDFVTVTTTISIFPPPTRRYPWAPFPRQPPVDRPSNRRPQQNEWHHFSGNRPKNDRPTDNRHPWPNNPSVPLWNPNRGDPNNPSRIVDWPTDSRKPVWRNPWTNRESNRPTDNNVDGQLGGRPTQNLFDPNGRGGPVGQNQVGVWPDNGRWLWSSTNRTVNHTQQRPHNNRGNNPVESTNIIKQIPQLPERPLSASNGTDKRQEICSDRTNCPTGWVQDIKANRCYYFAKFRQRRNVEQAQTVCQKENGYLLVVNEKTEWEYIAGELHAIRNDYPGFGFDGFWIGYRYDKPTDTWTWDLGAGLTNVPWLPEARTPWREKRDSDSMKRSCADIRWEKTQWGVDNDSCMHRQWFICELCYQGRS